jgi:hypothetical protein
MCLAATDGRILVACLLAIGGTKRSPQRVTEAPLV